MTRKGKPTYLAFYLAETDGDVAYRRGTVSELKAWCWAEHRCWSEITLVEGQVVTGK